MKKKKNVRITVRLDEELYERVQRAVVRDFKYAWHHRSLGEWCRGAILATLTASEGGASDKLAAARKSDRQTSSPTRLSDKRRKS